MVKMTLGVEGMACGMREAHINEAVRNQKGLFSAFSFIQ